MDKKYDWMAILQYQPNYTLSDFKDLGVTPENTEFRSKDYYKGLEAVRNADIFKKDSGEFDEKKFDKFYDEAALLYNNYANEEVFNNLGNSYTYDPWEWWNKDASKVKDTSPKIVLGENPWAITSGIKGLGIVTESPYSIREMAQRRPYYDYTTGEWSDKTPNDYAGIFKSWTAPTLVLATYDQDETEIDENGRTIVHKKGEIKLDKDNLPFYETLGNRDSSGKDFLHNEDIYSVDGSQWNKLDIFDADGKRTDPAKVFFKTVARVVPYLLPWGIGQAYAYLKAGQAMAEFIPTFLKSVDAVFTNDVMGNDFGRTMNDIVGYVNRLDHSVSDHSREQLITWENVGKMFADVSGQLFEQKAIGGLTGAKIFNKYSSIRNNAALSKALAYGYMATTSAEEAYDIFKQAGANDATAGLAMWALIGVYYKLMNADYYKHALFRNSIIDEKNIKEPAKRMADLYKNAISLDDAAVSSATEEQAAKTLNWFQRNWEKVLGISGKLEDKGIIGGKTLFSSALSEGVEETMEELSIDALKAMAKALEAIGFNVSEDELDFGFSARDVLTRYGTSFIGGAFGGTVFHGYNLLDARYREAHKAQKLEENIIGDIVTLVMQNRQNELYKEFERGFNAKEYGSSDLSATKFNVVRDVNGEVVAFEGANGEMSQNEMVYNEIYKTVKFIENILKSNKFIDVRNKVKDILKVDDETAARLLFTGQTAINFNAENLILDDLRKLGTDIVSTVTKMKAIEESLLPKDQDGGEQKLKDILKDNLEYQELSEKLKELQKQRDIIYNKENLFKYMLQASVVLNKDVVKDLLGFSNVNEYAQVAYGKPLSQFTKKQQDVIQNEFDEYYKGEKVQLFETSRIYNILSEKFANILAQKESELSKVSPDDTVRIETVGTEFFTKLTTLARLSDNITALTQKENKTEEEEKRLKELQEQRETLETEIRAINDDPQRLFSRVHVGEFQQENLHDFARTLQMWYKSLEGKHKYDDIDLQRFLDKIKNNYAFSLIQRGIYQIIEDFRVSQGLDYDEGIAYTLGMDENNPRAFFWAHPGDSDTQDELFGLIKNFYNGLSVSSEEAIEAYEQIRTLLKDKVGFDDKQIDEFLSRDLGEVDATSVRNSFGISIIPFLNGQFLPDILREINNSRSKIIYGDGQDLIKEFFAIVGDDSLISLLDLLEQEEKRITNVGEYTIGNNLYRNQLKTLLSIVNAVSAVVNGSYNGLNEFLNPYRLKEKLEQYTVITENTAKILHNDLETLKNRINFVLKLDAKNSGLKLREQKDVGANMRVKFLQKLTNHVYVEDFANKENGFGIDLKQLISDNTSADFNLEEVTSENFDRYEKEIIAIETALYNKIKESGLSDEDIISKLIKIYGDSSLYKQLSTNLTKEKDEIVTTYDTIVYAATIMKLNSNDFYVLYRNAIQHAKDIDPNFDIVPVFGQEYALRLIYAYSKNRNFFNILSKEIANTYQGSEKYQLNKRILRNFVSVFGGAGTGKSRGVGAMLMHIFPDAEFRVIGPTNTQVDSLLNIFGKAKDSSDGLTISEFKEKVIPNVESETDKEGKVTVKLKYNNETEQIEAEDYEQQNWSWFGNDGKLRFVVVDEAAMNNSFVLQVLSDYGVKNDAMIIALGDPKQNTGSITYLRNGKVNTQPDGYEETIGIKAPYLVANFRANYRSKADNYVSLLHLITTIDDEIQKSDTGKTKQDINDIWSNKVKGTKTQLKYMLLNQGIAGDLITSEEEAFKKLIDRALETNRSILLVTDASTSGKYIDEKFNKPNITKRSATEAQGGEYDYVFIDKAIDLEKDGAYNVIKDLYTITQRSRFGSIVYDKNDTYGKELQIYSKLDPASATPWEMSPNQKAEYANWRLNALKDLVPSENFNDNVTIETIIPEPEDKNTKKQYITPETFVQEEQKPEDGSEKVETQEEKESTEVEEQREQEEDEQVENETPNNPAIPHVQPLVLELTPMEGTNVKIELSDWEEKESNEGLNTATEDVPSGTGYYDITEFLNRIFTSEFYSEQTKDKNSLFNVLKENGVRLKELDYQSLVWWITRKILTNDFDFTSINGLTLRDREAPNVLKKIFKSFSPKYVNVETIGEKSLLSVVFGTLSNQITFEVPISISQTILGNGIIALGENKPFEIYGKVDYDHTTTKQIRLKELFDKYPWLRYVPFAGTLIGNSFKDKTGSIYDNVKAFVERNAGKTFMTFFGLKTPKNIKNLFNNSVHPITREMWLGEEPLNTTKAGIQKVVENFDDVFAYAAALNYMTTWDEDSKRYLEKVGWITKRGNENEQLVSKLYELTGNDLWQVDILVTNIPNQTKDNNRRKELWRSYFNAIEQADKQSTLISWTQSERILADLLGNMLNNETKFENAWLKLHTKFHNNNDRSFSLIIKLDPTHEFIIYSDSKTNTPGKIYVSTYNKRTHRPEKVIKTIDTEGKVDTFKQEFSEAISNILALTTQPLNLSNFNSERIRVTSASITWNSDGTINKLYESNSLSNWFNVFNSNKTDALESVLNEFKFKYGLYGNIPYSSILPGSAFGQSDLDEKYVTMASDWHAETVYINPALIVNSKSEDPGKTAAIQLDGRNTIANIINEAKSLVSSKYLNEIEQKYSNLLVEQGIQDDVALDELLGNMINEINQNILNNARSKRVSVLSFDSDLMNVVKKSIDSKDYAYRNLIRDEYGVELESLRGESNKITGVDVIIGNIEDERQTHFVFFEYEGDLKVLKTKNYDNWKSLMNTLNVWSDRFVGIDGESNETDIFSKTRNELDEVGKYLSSLLTNTVSDNSVKRYWDIISKYLKDLQEYRFAQNVQSELEKYLISRINDNEC